MKFARRITRLIDREWIAQRYSARTTLLHRLLWVVPLFVAIAVIDVLGIEEHSTLGGWIFAGGVLGMVVMFFWTFARFWAGVGATSTKRSEKTVRQARTRLAKRDEVNG